MRELGMTLRLKPDPTGKPGHVVAPELNAENGKCEPQESWRHAIANACEVPGPFDGMG